MACPSRRHQLSATQRDISRSQLNFRSAQSRCLVVFLPTSYSHPPRRLPRDESGESEEEPRRRDLILFLGCLIFLSVILFVGSYLAEGAGQIETALSLRIVGALFATATVGTVVTVGIGYYITGAFLKREFDKRFKKMDEEEQAQLRRLTGQSDGEKESA
jgi:membrane protein DedA with SNARE-associated domain